MYRNAALSNGVKSTKDDGKQKKDDTQQRMEVVIYCNILKF